MSTGEHHRLGVIDEDGNLVEDPDWRGIYWESTDDYRVASVTAELITAAVASGVISAEAVAQARAEGRIGWLIDLGRAMFVVQVAGQPVGACPFAMVANTSSPDVT